MQQPHAAPALAVPALASHVAAHASVNGSGAGADTSTDSQSKRPRFSLAALPTSVSTSDPAFQSRMSSLLHEVDAAAKKQVGGALAGAGGADDHQLERLISTNREHVAEIARLNQGAAQREALVASLQVQLTQARIQVQQAQDAEEAHQSERDRLVSQQAHMVQQAQAQLAQQQQQLQQQLQTGLAAAAQSQAAQQAVVCRMASFLSRTHQWLQCLSNRCAAQSLEYPIECTNALNLLKSVATITDAFASPPEGAPAIAAEAPAAAAAAHAAIVHSGTAPHPAIHAAMPPPHVAMPPPSHAATAAMHRDPAMLPAATPMPAFARAAAPAALAAAIHQAPPAPAEKVVQATGKTAAAVAASSGLEMLAVASEGADEQEPGGSGLAPRPAPGLPTAAASTSAQLVDVTAAPTSALESTACSPSLIQLPAQPTPPIGLSPSNFCSLLSSPDLTQLMSPHMSPGGVWANGANGGATGASLQFKRRQTGSSNLASNMAI